MLLSCDDSEFERQITVLRDQSFDIVLLEESICCSATEPLTFNLIDIIDPLAVPAFPAAGECPNAINLTLQSTNPFASTPSVRMFVSSTEKYQQVFSF